MKKQNVNMTMNFLNDYMMRLKKEICEINPKFSIFFDVLDEMGCDIEYCKGIGLYGAIRIKYRSQYLYIWIREDDTFMICYPNWISMNKAQMSSVELESIIRPINMSYSVSIVWEVNDDMVLMSSFGNILLGQDNESNLTSVKRLFDELFETPYYFEAGCSGKTKQRDNADKQDINTLLSILENCGCSKIEVDDEGDIAIVYNGKNLLARIINGNFIKISYNSSQYENVSQERIPDDYELGISQIFQWNNIIFPIKCSYYVPRERCHSVTVYIDFNLLPDYEDNVAFVKQILPQLIYADNNQLSGHLLSDSEEAIEDINTWCVPHTLLEQIPREI